MKKRIVSLLLAAALLTGAASAAGEEGAAEQPDLDLSAASAVLMEKETGALLYEKESHQQLEPASVTKVMTLLLIMEDLDSGRLSKEDLVTVSAAAAGMGGSQVYLKEGEQLSAGELIKCGPPSLAWPTPALSTAPAFRPPDTIARPMTSPSCPGS